MVTRRQFLQAAGAAALAPYACAGESVPAGVVVNDVHSRLNATRVSDIAQPRSLLAVRELVREAKARGRALAVAGGRHAMGGQQFGTGARLIDTTLMSRVLAFDLERGTIEVEAGIEWPELIAHYLERQAGRPRQWGIAQKPAGADRISIGGALAANIHGCGLAMRPFVADIEAFTLVDANGVERRCSRAQQPELFRLAVGGYGLFGIVYAVTLRLVPRRVLERAAELVAVADLAAAFARRKAAGALYGNVRLATDPAAEDFLSAGVFSSYRPVETTAPPETESQRLAPEDWEGLVALAHTRPTVAYQRVAAAGLEAAGQLVWADTCQLATYADGYHARLDARVAAQRPASEMMGELAVPLPALAGFLTDAREHLRHSGVPVVAAAVRVIERDDETFLAWAQQTSACVIVELHAEHTASGLARVAEAFRGLIDLAIQRGGSYALAFHRYARRDQVGTCYPQLPQFLRLKRRYDPDERFQSDWYRDYRAAFADVL